jgi:hypothetical protein
VRLDVLGGNIVSGIVSYYPKLRIFWNRLVGVSSVGAPLRVFRSTLQGLLNQSIVDLSPRYPGLLNQLAMISLNGETMWILLCEVIVLYNS